MPPLVIEIQTTDDIRDVVHRAVQSLAEGQLVAFPSETIYAIAASALNGTAVERLAEIKQRPDDDPFGLAIKSASEALDFAPTMSALAKRLARRCWPGPTRLVLPTAGGSLADRLPEETRKWVCPDGEIGLRVPAHSILLDVLRMTIGPVVLSSATRPGKPDSHYAKDVVNLFGDDISLVLDDGPARFKQRSTIVRVIENQFEIAHQGIVSEKNVARFASVMILFICTGNTCRSPMAEILCKKLIAENLGCEKSELESNGVVIQSAGLAAMPGSPPSKESVLIMDEVGLDLTRHQSQPLSQQMLADADHVFCMTSSHLHAIQSQWPESADRVSLLCMDQSDVPDPIGGTVEHYRICANQIETHLKNVINDLQL